MQQSLERYDRDKLARSLESKLTKLIPSRGQPITNGIDHAVAVWKTIANHTGRWSHAGPVVGGETLSGWCWCHSYGAAISGEGHAERVARCVREILLQLDHIHAYLNALAKLFDSKKRSLRDPERRTEALGLCFDDLLDVVVQWSGCHDAWYHNLLDACRWASEASGLRISAPAKAEIERAVRSVCTSWVEPSSADWATAALDLAIVLQGERSR